MNTPIISVVITLCIAVHTGQARAQNSAPPKQQAVAKERAQEQAKKQVYDPISAYHKESIQGFTVLINEEVLKHKKPAAQMRKELESQLKDIIRVMPTDRLPALQKVRIWVEWQKKKNGAAEFHPSKKWLTNNGYNPEKEDCVELNNTRNFVKWSRGAQPWMVLHEMAHAYHHLTLGFDHQGVKAAYQQAADKNLYDSVDFITGGKKRAYALTNEKEYFAELSEAYFGKNDFFPYTHDRLKKHDPVGYQLMKTSWGTPKNKQIKATD